VDSSLAQATISAKKIALLHVAKRQLGLDDDAWRDLLRSWGEVESSAALTERGFTFVMLRLEQLDFRSTRNFGDRPGMASSAQIGFIRSMWLRIEPDDAGEAKLNAWLERFHRVSALRFVDARRAQSVITALRSMSSRRQDRI
jgi:hypothetical protein